MKIAAGIAEAIHGQHDLRRGSSLPIAIPMFEFEHHRTGEADHRANSSDLNVLIDFDHGGTGGTIARVVVDESGTR